jgi:Holliday junction resolvase RusA-like endonuclease
VSFFAAGRAISQPRAQQGRGGHKIMAPARHAIHGWRQTLKLLAQQAMAGKVPVTGPLRLETLFLFHRPQRLCKPENVDDLVLCDQDPDVDNLAKALMDAFLMVVWVNDNQVTTCVIRKRFAQVTEAPGVVVRVYRDEVPW